MFACSFCWTVLTYLVMKLFVFSGFHFEFNVRNDVVEGSSDEAEGFSAKSALIDRERAKDLMLGDRNVLIFLTKGVGMKSRPRPKTVSC